MRTNLGTIDAQVTENNVRPTCAERDRDASERKYLAHGSRLRDVAADALRATSGNARAASIDMGVHEGHLSRLLKDGTVRLEQLEVLGPVFAVKFGQQLIEQFGALANPRDHARRTVQQIEECLVEIKQFIDDAV